MNEKIGSPSYQPGKHNGSMIKMPGQEYKPLLVIPDYENMPIEELPGLEWVFKKGYIIDDRDNKLEHISIKSQPLLLHHALDNICRQEGYNSISHVQRVAILYATSLFQHDPLILSILQESSDISLFCEDRETLCENSKISTLDFIISSSGSPGTISLFAWCLEWIVSNCRRLGLGRTQLATYLLIYGLSSYPIQNKTVREDIQLEANHFMNYLKKRHATISRITEKTITLRI